MRLVRYSGYLAHSEAASFKMIHHSRDQVDTQCDTRYLTFDVVKFGLSFPPTCVRSGCWSSDTFLELIRRGGSIIIIGSACDLSLAYMKCVIGFHTFSLVFLYFKMLDGSRELRLPYHHTCFLTNLSSLIWF